MYLANNRLSTPYYHYDMKLLNKTLQIVKREALKYNFQIHYALKANANKSILTEISKMDFGADCVSGNEINKAIHCGFDSNKIVFAGVGKTDKEIITALKAKIFCLNCESIQEIEVVNAIAKKMQIIAPIALRINPGIDAKTHKYITTGTAETKFGISVAEIPECIERIKDLSHINLIGLHVHLGSQITNMKVFESLCHFVNDIQAVFSSKAIRLSHLNLGGGLGVAYKNPDENMIPDFASYFSIINKTIKRKNNETIHLEPGRSIVAQCGSLITKVLYVKKNSIKNFVIIDAGMTDLLRPALYNSYHKIENLSSKINKQRYDIVGPICESSDFLGKDVLLSEVQRGDYLEVKSVGAYGESMALSYNLRNKTKARFS